MYIYFVRAGSNGPIKIGVASNVDKRVETLQTGNHQKLTVITVIKCRDKSDAYHKESTFHKMFEHKRIRGEWFHGDIRINLINQLSEVDRAGLENDFTCKDSDSALIASCPF